MFATHQKEISAYAQTGPDQMARVVTFVYLTVQQSIFDMPDFMKDVDMHGTESPYLWGFKIGAYEWLQKNKGMLYDVAMHTYRGHADPDTAELELIQMWAGLPGLGLVKGGFCNQLIFGLTGCIDTHNIEMYKTDPREFTASRFKRARARKRVELATAYKRQCAALGGPEMLWDNWCEYVAERNKTGAERVSALHTEAIL